MNLYAAYVKEREGKDVLKNENGFITYKIIGQELFLADMFLVKKARGSEVVSQFIEKLVQIGKDNKCSHISANIHLADSGANRTLKAALKLGFKLINANNNILVIVKEVS